ncbi:uroporphyrinogen-III C-methyltransferase [Methylonatrum kenyense]|uniref:uroporphyrinogen-III C-methyltransferase n=1 Tax=Methylonatrum kenyense TaxID=455253 RepID=UPI0020BDD752|nr:uroporphyrinogen-III C-methyltransferase [Methylonatrum kenyense]MCK8515299.1 uroporphyrinogen-III C-methyltransferase [Methylonatrum kenyense]
MSDDKQRESDTKEQAAEHDEASVDAAAESQQEGSRPEDDGGPGGERTPSSETSGGGRGSGIAILALIISLLLAMALAVGGWLLWQRQQELIGAQDTVADADEVAALRDDLESGLDEIRDSAVARADRLEGRVDNLAAEHQAHVQTLARAEELMQGVRERQSRVDERLERLQELTDDRREEWARTEVEYLLGLAVHRVRLYQDPDSALAALREADAILRALDADTVNQRRAIRDAIEALLDVRLPDRGAHAVELRELMTSLDDFAVHQPDTRLDPQAMGRQRDAELDSVEGWREAGARAWLQFRESLASLVVVHRGEPAPPLMGAEEEWYLRENLRLSLQGARIALLLGDQRVWEDSLGEADDWLQRYFQQDDGVRAARERLQELKALELRPELPDLAELLPELDRFDEAEEDDS